MLFNLIIEINLKYEAENDVSNPPKNPECVNYKFNKPGEIHWNQRKTLVQTSQEEAKIQSA